MPYFDDLDLDVSIFNGLTPCSLDVRIEISFGTFTDGGYSRT